MDLHQFSCGRTSKPRVQGEGGELGDAQMPMLSLVAVTERLQVGEFLYTFYDDLYMFTQAHRTGQWNVPTFCIKSFGSIAGNRSKTGKVVCGTEQVSTPRL